MSETQKKKPPWLEARTIAETVGSMLYDLRSRIQRNVVVAIHEVLTELPDIVNELNKIDDIFGNSEKTAHIRALLVAMLVRVNAKQLSLEAIPEELDKVRLATNALTTTLTLERPKTHAP